MPPTIAELAGEAYDWFTTRTREGSDETYVTLKDGRPDWVHSLAMEAHGRDADGSPSFLPDDWRYDWAQDALGAIHDAGEDADLDDVEHEFADNVDVYTHDRLKWLSSNLQRSGYCDEAAEELGAVDMDIIQRIGLGQYAERREIFGLVLASLRERLEGLEGGEDD